MVFFIKKFVLNIIIGTDYPFLSNLRKINMNRQKLLANPIVAYRTEHRFYSKVEDVKKVMAVTEEIYNKIFPYLTVL